MQAVGHGEEVTSLYRAVAKAELDDIAQAGFRQHPDALSLESKLFATSPEDAARFGRDNFRFDDVPFHIIEVQMSTSIADQFEKLTLDFKPAVNVSRDVLPLLNQHATVREITPIPMGESSMSALLTISAKIYFLSPEEGGRETPIFSGYRPALYFGEKQTDGAIMLTSGGHPVPGTECEVIIKLLHPEHVGDALKPMTPFEVKEGSRVVGRGQVLCTHDAAAKA